MNEESIISLFLSGQTRKGDDCADLPSGDVVTTDSMVEGTHFRLKHSSPEDLAWKLVHSNLSDLACSGARPRWALLNLGIPPELSEDFLQAFSRTLKQELSSPGCEIYGGDTFRAPVLSLGLTLGGPVEYRRLYRNRARPGDVLYISGTLGLSMAGLLHLEGERIIRNETVLSQALRKHNRPEARMEWARLIQREPGIRGAMDVSDGLLVDAGRMADASGVRIRLLEERIPVDPLLRNDWSGRDAALSGEEYELLFYGDDDLSFPFPATSVGLVLPGPAGVEWMDANGISIPDPRSGFQHFV